MCEYTFKNSSLQKNFSDSKNRQVIKKTFDKVDTHYYTKTAFCSKSNKTKLYSLKPKELP